MNGFDQWFYSQNRAVQVILLLLPVVGWVIECLVRLSVLLKRQDVVSMLAFVLFIVVGWGWVLCLIDVCCLLSTGRLLLA